MIIHIVQVVPGSPGCQTVAAIGGEGVHIVGSAAQLWYGIKMLFRGGSVRYGGNADGLDGVFAVPSADLNIGLAAGRETGIFPCPYRLIVQIEGDHVALDLDLDIEIPVHIGVNAEALSGAVAFPTVGAGPDIIVSQPNLQIAAAGHGAFA